MQSSFRLGKIMGIEIGVHYTWLIVFALITWSLAVSFPQQFPGWSPITYWIVGATSALLLFASVLVHELAHSIVAIRAGLPVSSIVLFIFGGVSNISREPQRPSDELYMSIVGPATSLILGIIFGILLFSLRGVSPEITAILFYLTFTNIALAIFNLIPGFPLDGGRVLRAIVWWLTGNLLRATRIATIAGQLTGYILILGGLLWAFAGNFLGGIWLAIIGWFLTNAAEASYRQVALQDVFRRFRVRELMNPHPVTVQPWDTLEDVVNNYILQRNVRALPVVENGELVGLITLADVREVPQQQWGEVPVKDVMKRTTELHTVSPDSDLGQVLRSMAEEDINQLPVVVGNRLVGLLSRSQIMRFLQVREELGLRG